MPRLRHALRTQALEGVDEVDAPGRALVAELTLAGFVDAPNFVTFEKALAEAAGGDTRHVLVDFSRVQYINSTGISALIRYFEECRTKGGVLCLCGVSKPVGLSMHLLGITSLIPFARDLVEGRTYIARHVASSSRGASSVQRGPSAEVGKAATSETLERLLPVRPPADTAATGRVLVISPARSRFTNVLGRRIRRRRAEYHLVYDIQEALRRFDEIRPDLVVIDHRSDPEGEFVSRVKLQRDRSLTSLIKVYPSRTNVLEGIDFKIWENDYLVDPFEVLDFFTLAEAELLRVPRDRKVFSQQVRFQFRTLPANIEKACRLSDVVIRSAMKDEDEITALYAAVKEGIDNAVVHGNARDEDKSIDVNFLIDHAKVTVIVEDEGSGFDYEYYLSRLHREDAFEEAKRRIVEDDRRGGLGILLMSRCSDRILYSGPGNTLRLEKNLG